MVTNIRLRVFISYSHKHEHLMAGFLTQALENQGFDVLYDRRIYGGSKIVEEIRQYILDSHAVVLILSNNSVESPWVNQELGFALAHNIPIIPIQAGSSELKPFGMLSETKPLELKLIDLKDFDPCIKKLKKNIYESVDKAKAKTRRPEVIESKNDRAERIIKEFDRLNNILDNNNGNENRHKLKLYKRTSVSIFSVKGDLKKETHRYHDDYWNLLINQRETIERFVNKSDVEEVRLHLCPRAHIFEEQTNRIENLIDFLEECNTNKNKLELKNKLKLKLQKHNDINVVAVDNHFVFEGLRPGPDNEYLYTLYWSYPSSRINDYFRNISVWQGLDKSFIDRIKTNCYKIGSNDCNYVCLK